jgi:fibronectin-binding autotransporter adhesin
MAGGMQTKARWIGRASRGHAGMVVFRSLAFGGLLLAIHAPALAEDRQWLGGSGAWGTGSNWTPAGVPTTGDTAEVTGPSGTVVTLLTNTGTLNVGITVRSGNTLLGNGTEGNNTQRLGNGATLTNQGTIENAVIQTANTVTNTGLIQANGAGKYMNLSAAVTFVNTGATVRAVSGGTLNVLSNVTVSNGTLSIDSTSRMQLLSDNRTFTLSNVAATNNGTMTLGMNLNASNDRSVQTNLNGTTTFDNFGTINLSLASPAGSTSGTKTSQMVVASTAAFTNRSTGTLNVLNSTTQTAGTTAAYFQMNATGFNNEGAIAITTNPTSTGTAQFRAPNVGFSNAGSITVDGSRSSIQMATRTLTQTAGSLSLINGGTMTAGAVLVNGGTLRGTGTISAPVTIGGILAPGNAGIGTLSVTNSVTWNAGNSWLFQLGASAPSLAAATAGTDSDLLAVSTAFTKGTAGSFTFDFGNSGADGWYKLVSYASTTFASGDFQATNVPSGKTANFVVDPASTALYVQIVPEPGMLALAGLGMGVATLSFMKCRRRA